MKLFIAIKVNNDKINLFARLIQKEINENFYSEFEETKALEKIRVNNTFEFHITLKFLKDFSKEDVSQIIEEFRDFKAKKFSVSLKEISVFHNIRKNKSNSIVYLDFYDSDDMNNLVYNLRDLINKRFREITKEDIDKLDFKTHITLSRIKYGIDSELGLDLVRNTINNVIKRVNSKYKEMFNYHILNINEVELIETTHTKNGVKYKTLSKNYL